MEGDGHPPHVSARRDPRHCGYRRHHVGDLQVLGQNSIKNIVAFFHDIDYIQLFKILHNISTVVSEVTDQLRMPSLSVIQGNPGYS